MSFRVFTWCFLVLALLTVSCDSKDSGDEPAPPFKPQDVTPNSWFFANHERYVGYALWPEATVDDSKLTDIAVRAVPVNVLLTVVSSSGEETGASFTKSVVLERPGLEAFASMVQELLESEGIIVPRDVIRAACVDRQVDAKGKLSVASAVSVARSLAAKHG